MGDQPDPEARLEQRLVTMSALTMLVMVLIALSDSL
jgi:hypothetical protein